METLLPQAALVGDHEHARGLRESHKVLRLREDFDVPPLAALGRPLRQLLLGGVEQLEAEAQGLRAPPVAVRAVL